ncbi:MAG: hypothetical protein NPINA01_23210 [Nitrospinaceae bacterium]|nr:MAG: hypothetical protein NPINA01_23210 [Nitrospinaceae bacterium]
MQEKYDTIKKMEVQLEKIDKEMMKFYRKMEQTHFDSDIPLPVRREMEKLIDSRKDFADKLQEMRWELETSWEELEKAAVRLLDGLTQSVRKIDELI